MKAGSGYARPIADGQLQHLARSRTRLVPPISERGKKKQLITRRQVTTDPLPRRTNRISRRPSSSSISRTRNRSATCPVWGIGRPGQENARPGKRDLLRH
jgi:hypothetical protein